MKYAFLICLFLMGCASSNSAQSKVELDFTPYNPDYELSVNVPHKTTKVIAKYDYNKYINPYHMNVYCDGKNTDIYYHIIKTLTLRYFGMPEVYQSYPVEEVAKYVVITMSDEEFLTIYKSGLDTELIYKLDDKYRNFVMEDMEIAGIYSSDVKITFERDGSVSEILYQGKPCKGFRCSGLVGTTLTQNKYWIKKYIKSQEKPVEEKNNDDTLYFRVTK